MTRTAERGSRRVPGTARYHIDNAQIASGEHQEDISLFFSILIISATFLPTNTAPGLNPTTWTFTVLYSR